MISLTPIFSKTLENLCFDIAFSVFFILFINLTFAATAIGHAPIGVSGDHYHKANENMLSIRYATMQMKGNSLHGESISDQEIITSQVNPFASMSGAPAYLSVVPKKMEMEMMMVYLFTQDLSQLGFLQDKQMVVITGTFTIIEEMLSM